MKVLRSITTRFLFATVVSGSVAGVGATAALVHRVGREDEARLVDEAVREAERRARDLDQRVALARANLASWALRAGTASALERGPEAWAQLEALRVSRGDQLLFDASRDGGDVPALGRAGDAPVEVLPDGVLVRHTEAGVVAAGWIDTSFLSLAPPGWSVTLAIPDRAATTISARRTRRDGADWVTVAAPTGPDVLGEVHVEAPLAPAQAAAAALGLRLFLWSTLGLPLLVAVGWALARTTTRPLRRLAAAVEAAGDDAVELPPMPRNEIGDVAAAVDRLSGRAQEQARVLRCVAASVRRLAMASEPQEVLRVLSDGLEETLPGHAWTASQVALVDTPETASLLGVPGGSIKRALARMQPVEVAVAEPRRPDAGELGHVLVPEPDGTLVVPLRTLGRDFGLLVGRGVGGTSAATAVDTVVAMALARLRQLEVGRIVATHDRRAMLGGVLLAVGGSVNVPASVIATALHVLVGTDEDAEPLEEARDAARQLLDEVREIAAFAGQATEIHVERVALRDIIESARVQAAGVVPHVTVSTRCTSRHDIYIYADRQQSEQALLLLVLGAQEAAAQRPNARVEVIGRDDGDRVHVDVVDRGGVAEPTSRATFPPFASTRRRPGSNLGLYLARCFARSQGGDVVQLTDGGPGATYRLVLPSDASRRETDRTRSRRILVIADAGDAARLARWSPPGTYTTTASSAREALGLLRSYRFDGVMSTTAPLDTSARDLERAIEEVAPNLRGRVTFLFSEGAGSVEPGARTFRCPVDAAGYAALIEEIAGAPRDDAA